MKRAKIQEVAQEAVARTKTETPFFVKQLKGGRKEILNAINSQSGVIRNSIVSETAIHMRAMQILNSFIRKKKLSSVESGRIDNIKFNTALELAFAFMRVHAENVHNKAFKRWVEDNLIEMGYDDKIIKIKNSNFII